MRKALLVTACAIMALSLAGCDDTSFALADNNPGADINGTSANDQSQSGGADDTSDENTNQDTAQNTDPSGDSGDDSDRDTGGADSPATGTDNGMADGPGTGTGQNDDTQTGDTAGSDTGDDSQSGAGEPNDSDPSDSDRDIQPPPGPTTACDDLDYPSAAYTQCETENVAVSNENITQHADLLPGIAAASADYQARYAETNARPNGRMPAPNPCSGLATCPIDPRLQNWTDHGGIVEKVLYTSRSGGTISGRVWATDKGPAKRPGIVIVNGSIVGFEQLYWYAAQALAKAGFVVMTFDAQGEGMSDQFGEAPDRREDAFAGTPVLSLLQPEEGTGGPLLGGNGLPFYDGGEDAINFFFSTPNEPYEPVPSRSSGTSHAAKQQRRVAAGQSSANNPLWKMLDRDRRIGLAGHSYGAEAVSFLGQRDDRVATVVAWDNLCVPTIPSPGEGEAVGMAKVFGPDQPPGPVVYGLPKACFGAPYDKAPEITKPALGITSDYFIAGPVAYPRPPDAKFNSKASRAYSAAGVDSGELVIRGGTHFEYNDAPTALPATLRGIDLVTWYTVGWFKKYLQNDPEGSKMLRTVRWRDDERTGAVDPGGDPNLFSWHYLSRLDITLADGTQFKCEDLRRGCNGQVKKANDGGRDNYSFAAVDTSPARR